MQQQQVNALFVITIPSMAEIREKCAWCWPERHPGEPYPEEWSSTICQECSAHVVAERARIKAARATAKVATREVER